MPTFCEKHQCFYELPEGETSWTNSVCPKCAAGAEVATGEPRKLSDRINSLPGWARQYIHDIETKCDPAGDIRTITELRDTIRSLTAPSPKGSGEQTAREQADGLNAEEVGISLFGCCSYEDSWRPGIEGWGGNDAESRANGYVSVPDYDKLLELYRTSSRESQVVKELREALEDDTLDHILYIVRHVNDLKILREQVEAALRNAGSTKGQS